MRNQTNAGYSAAAIVLSVRNIFPILSMLLIALFSTLSASAQCPLTCKGNSYVSLGVDGKATITIYNVMNNPPPTCINLYSISLMDTQGHPVNNPLTCANLGQTIKYIVTDISNGNSCWGYLYVEDKLPPQLFCADITIECNDPTDAATIGKAITTDNCDQSPIILLQGEIITQIDCDNPIGVLYTISRTWIAKDASGNFSLPCTQKISIRKPNINLVQYPPNYTSANGNFLDCTVSNTSPDTLGEPTYKGKPLTLMCKIIFTHSDSIEFRCSGSRVIFRTWTVVDCCNNTINTHLQLIELMDKTPPVVICPADFIVPTKPGLCVADVLLPIPIVTDNCSDSITINISGAGFGALGFGPYLNVLPGFYEVKYTICDDCNNCTMCQLAFEVKELELPVVVCNNDITLSLDGTGMVVLNVDEVNNGTYDNCCLDSLDIKIMGQSDSLYGQIVKFNCEDVNQSFWVILRATDCHGNENFCMSNVHIIDLNIPIIICPDDVTVYCTSPVVPDSTGIPQVGDVCGIDSLFFKDSLVLTPCNTGEIIRIWTAIDSAGNIANCIQLISVIDTTAPMILFPPDITINCILTPDSTLTGFPQIQDDCSLFHISHTDQLVNVPAGCNRIERTWKVLNLCDNSLTTDIQNIVLFDNTNPVWQTKPGVLDLTVECDKDVFVPVPIAADNCTFVNVVKTLDVTVPICKNKYTRTIVYTALDGCENASVPFIVKITVNDIKAPILSNCPLDTIILLPADSCSKYLAFVPATAIDNCGEVILTNNSQFATNKNSGNISGTYPIGVHVVMIFADDGCGNRDTCTVNINIKDVTPPSVNCEGSGLTLIGTISTVDSLFILTPQIIIDNFSVFDKCSPVTITASPDSFGCGDLGLTIVHVIITDAFGNVSTCDIDLLVVDSFNVCDIMFNNGNLIMGHLTTPFKTPVKNTNVDVHMNNELDHSKSDANGYYMYAHIPDGKNVTIHPSKDDDYLNGVDILDLIYLTKYILGTGKLPNPYSKLAGDVNESHTISVGDLGEIRRLILQDQLSFSCGKSWKFIDSKCKGDIFKDALSPLLPEQILIPVITYHSLLNDFIAVKLGDVDFSSKSYSAFGELEVRSNDKAVIELPDIHFEKGKTYDIEINLKDPGVWAGIQAGFQFADAISIEDVKPGNINNMKEENIYNVGLSSGKLNFLWNTMTDGANMNQNSLLKLRLSSSTEGYLSEFVNLNEKDFNNISYDRTLIQGNVELAFKKDVQSNIKSLTRIYANRPNPFSSETIWPVYSEESNNKVSLTISSSDGKQIISKNIYLTSGYNELKLDSKDLPGKGCYLYQIITSDNISSGKIILH